LVSDFLVVVKGGIGNLDDLKFIVDTGATWSVIDRKVAVRLTLGVSHPYATLIKRGISIPHPRHWLPLADLAGYRK
jgi:hypothetical protein